MIRLSGDDLRMTFQYVLKSKFSLPRYCFRSRKEKKFSSGRREISENISQDSNISVSGPLVNPDSRLLQTCKIRILGVNLKNLINRKENPSQPEYPRLIKFIFFNFNFFSIFPLTGLIWLLRSNWRSED